VIIVGLKWLGQAEASAKVSARINHQFEASIHISTHKKGRGSCTDLVEEDILPVSGFGSGIALKCAIVAYAVLSAQPLPKFGADLIEMKRDLF